MNNKKILQLKAIKKPTLILTKKKVVPQPRKTRGSKYA